MVSHPFPRGGVVPACNRHQGEGGGGVRGGGVPTCNRHQEKGEILRTSGKGAYQSVTGTDVKTTMCQYRPTLTTLKQPYVKRTNITNVKTIMR